MFTIQTPVGQVVGKREWLDAARSLAIYGALTYGKVEVLDGDGRRVFYIEQQTEGAAHGPTVP